MELIDKSKLLEELKRCEKICEDYMSSHQDAVSQGIANAKRVVCQHFIKFLDTLETKGVDLEEATINYLLHEHISPLNEVLHQADIRAEMQYHKDIDNAFKAGFELGIKSKGE